jgi:DNA-binding PadR family transcriptional regulator
MDRKLLLLGLLRQQEMHGYQLYEFIDRDLATCTDLKKPTAYFLLNKMAEDGWISEVQSREGNRPTRRVYRLTPQGEIEYQRMLRENLSSHTPTIFPGDTGLAFIDSLDPEEAAQLLKKRRSALAAALAEVQEAPVHRGSKQFVIDHQVRHLRAELSWLGEVIAQLEGKVGQPR